MSKELHPYRPVEIRFLTDPHPDTSPDMLILDHATGHFVRVNLDGAEQLANGILEQVKKMRAAGVGK